MGQHLGKREPHTDSMAPSPQPEVHQNMESEVDPSRAEPESQDEVFGKDFHPSCKKPSFFQNGEMLSTPLQKYRLFTRGLDN